MSQHDAEQDEIERWLDALGGRGDDLGDDTQTARIRQLVLRQQRSFEEEVDDLRVRRGRERLMTAVRSSRPASRNQHFRYFGLAASVVLVFAAGSVLLLNDTNDFVGDTTVKSFDGPDLLPDDSITITVHVRDVAATADELGRRMRDAQLSFERDVDDDGGVVFTVAAEDDESVQALSAALRDFAAPAILMPGTYRIRIR